MVDDTVEILFQETTSGEVMVTMPTREVLMLEPDAEDVYRRETVLAGKLAATVARDVVAQLKQVPAPVPSGPTEPSAPEHSLEGSVDSRPKRKRGRPEIPAELKQGALAVQGGKARAQILYQTKHPTPQQVKNVSSILRYYLKKCKSNPVQIDGI
jgi:hypothetical protein